MCPPTSAPPKWLGVRKVGAKVSNKNERKEEKSGNYAIRKLLEGRLKSIRQSGNQLYRPKTPYYSDTHRYSSPTPIGIIVRYPSV